MVRCRRKIALNKPTVVPLTSPGTLELLSCRTKSDGDSALLLELPGVLRTCKFNLSRCCEGVFLLERLHPAHEARGTFDSG